MVWAGRLRFTPGQQMWIKDEQFGLVEKHIESGLFAVLQSIGVEAAPEPVSEPEPAPEPEPVSEPEPAPEPEPELEMDEPTVVYTEATLKSMKLAELRPLAENLGISHSGVRKAALISLILAAFAGEE